MRFLLDENVSFRVAGNLKAAGLNAVHVGEVGLTNTDDTVILSRARDDGWVLVTADHDFVQMLFASGDTSPSLILIRDVQSLRFWPGRCGFTNQLSVRLPSPRRPGALRLSARR
jgi:predicted nuclease of predicted toxin-antitoxin system